MKLLLVALIVPTLVYAGTMPKPALTPGATDPAITQANRKSTLCNKHWSTRSIRPPNSYTESLKRQQIIQYGYDDHKLYDYEEDHLIPLEVGGAPRDPHNLWPEPLKGPWNAHIKDRLETRLHTLVCRGKISLDQARQCIATNWMDCYIRMMPKSKASIHRTRSK